MSRLNKHHVIPKSRMKDVADKNRDNIVVWDADFHAAYHFLFANMTTEEAKRFIDIVSKPDTKWTRHKLHRLREQIKTGG